MYVFYKVTFLKKTNGMQQILFGQIPFPHQNRDIIIA